MKTHFQHPDIGWPMWARWDDLDGVAGDLVVMWDLPDDWPPPTEAERDNMRALCGNLGATYDTLEDANRALRKAGIEPDWA